MKIDGVKNNVVSFYKNNTPKTELKAVALKKDTIELSTAGKSLSALSLDSKTVNSPEKIEAIRSEVMQGTYKMDSKLTATRMMDIMKGRDI
ncbi:flagellar biosynthesis anti-sigma factor FlgM [Clostridium tagluense]|uniref:flagellar biosynthesis anti-sigma factor FlgM n=1 Tax=Clostridium tagluense TaxID=360422 RepID=UPI001C0B0099|nr:flagellar biosynthesis anti-sigma factor FlgM [Clostridium tagluense]MBU3126687.1 flagellar biosynthesis anti-sigma factor FlgM [Clostridium tagluense]MCB2310046.1 flagellar biosynthesis anti-sigma factor FlgM [Clostridium tagluense]MCB2314424.1 flagellar biosynthesis anti-sigma factor FlgM [Clostridium tagluense]MCB2319270.1 flagellar biosynthesis anti-sigma factor FlgM [Clostridium tagluense]MCB2324640.1 flagellar biosynthesis anti-sigma factor FlgM [Clostridium tagluense]